MNEMIRCARNLSPWPRPRDHLLILLPLQWQPELRSNMKQIIRVTARDSHNGPMKNVKVCVGFLIFCLHYKTFVVLQFVQSIIFSDAAIGTSINQIRARLG